MKKNLFYYLFAVICSVALFTSCSDDDDEKMVNPVPQTTFTGENGLQLTIQWCTDDRVRKLLLLPMQPMLRRQLCVWKGNLT